MDIMKMAERLKAKPQTDGNAPERRRRGLSKLLVYPLMVLLFAGSLWLIFRPSEDGTETVGGSGGFNTEMPSPESKGLPGSKVDAYRDGEMAEKAERRKGSLIEIAEMLDTDTTGKVALPDVPMTGKPAAENENEEGTPQSSVAAYQDMNRTLAGFYSPAEVSQDDEVSRRIAEIERRLDSEPEKESSFDEKVALMEKSYELAARFGGNAMAKTTETSNASEKPKAEPVAAERPRVVSRLGQKEGADSIVEDRFNTAVGTQKTVEKNTIAACVHGTQTVTDGQALRLRLLEPMRVGGRLVPEGTVITGLTRLQGERMEVEIEAVSHNGSVLPVELEVYSTDGQKGILVPNSLENDAVKEIAAGMGGAVESGISISTDAGAQIVSDVGRGLIRGVSQYFTKKARTVKITVKAGYRLLLHPPEK